MKFFKNLWDRYGINPLDKALKQLGKKNGKILCLWNRGLGDIPLGLYAFKHKVLEWVPEAELFFLTRKDLEIGFSLLGGVHSLVDPELKRYQECNIEESLARLGWKTSDFDLIFDKLNPSRTLQWQLGSLIPKLTWNEKWDALYATTKNAIGIHVHSETVYGYEKNWPLAFWKELIHVLTQKYHKEVILFGAGKGEPLEGEKILDLRGKTDLIEVLSLLKNRCHMLIAPDSGILSMIYYVDAQFPLVVVSLWADPCQGVLRQNVASPNQKLVHIPLKAPREDLSLLKPDQVLAELEPFLVDSSIMRETV